ncbi:MAG: hypothetical protein IJ184_02755 [Alphaproteobacteria bacterium]|nr:hypothetical protein [Alphaproteobacteria bacterium]
MMFNKVKISIVPSDQKYEKVKLVQPNIIYNRFDIKYNGDFELLRVEYEKAVQYIAIHIHSDKKCYIGIYMTDLQQCVFDAIISFIKRKYGKKINKIHNIRWGSPYGKYMENFEKERKNKELATPPQRLTLGWINLSNKIRYYLWRKFSSLLSKISIFNGENSQVVTSLKSQSNSCYAELLNCFVLHRPPDEAMRELSRALMLWPHCRQKLFGNKLGEMK